MLQVQHVTAFVDELLDGMADVVHRRPSKNRFGSWLTGKDNDVSGQGAKLSKAQSRRGVVSGPRKMGQPPSTDHLIMKDLPQRASTTPILSSGYPEREMAFEARIETESPSKKNSFIAEYAFTRPPAWATKSGEWSPPVITPTPRYDIHEPAGPAYYINQHLRPPSSARPRTSFPPTPYNQSQTKTQSSASASGSAPKVTRQRTYTDDVDSLDVSDPHGTRWHHASPYELPSSQRTFTQRPKSQFVGPGVGTYAGPIEGSEPVESVRQTASLLMCVKIP